jgi:flagellar L-ring protein precursor FlgH
MKLAPTNIFSPALVFFFLIACVTPPPARPPAASPRETGQNLPARAEGSLWTPVSATLYADVKARNVGDIITVNVVESASASKNATTTTSRNSSLQAGWSGVLAKLAGNWVGTDQAVNFANAFDGKGETTRNSSLNTYITARVVHLRPNGNLVIQGSRQVTVNNENQYINIQGEVRPEDVSANNIVLSTFVADAVIELNGQGVVSDKQRTGWLTRILDYIWPF